MTQIVKAPLFEQLIAHAQSDPASFHVPGHRYGGAFQTGAEQQGRIEALARQWFMPLMRLDATELSATDDLHHPESAIKEAEQLAARLYGADHTYFLVGGSTAGNIAMLLAVCDPGNTVIVQRNVHKSVLNGLKLVGASAVFVMPEIDETTGIPTIPTVRRIEEALMRYPQTKAVLLSNPNYYGMGVVLDDYAEAVHRFGIPLLVDEAHGAHYGFHPELPRSSLRAGADGVVQSAHKTLHALTMGAWLHMQGDRIDRGRLTEALAMIQSSSPSFPIMASLDISRAIVEEKGEALFHASIQSSKRFRSELGNCCSSLATVDTLSGDASHYADPLRVLLTDRSGAWSGYRLQQELEIRGCWAEMADPRHVLLLFGLQTGERDVEFLLAACREIDVLIKSDAESEIYQSVRANPTAMGCQTSEGRSSGDAVQMGSEPVSQPVSFARSHSRASEAVPVEAAAGRIAAEMLVPYPPGIPLVYAGEQLTEAMTKYIVRLAEQGAKFQGASDPRMTTVRCYV